MDTSSQNVLANLPPASKSPLRGSPSFPKVSCESTPCLIHVLREFSQSFQWVLSRWRPLRGIASRTASPWVRSVLEGLSFPKVYHMVGQLLPAYAPRSTEPRSLACAAVIYGNQFPEGFCQSVPLLASIRSMAALVSLKFHVNLPRASSTYCLSCPKVSNASSQDGAPCVPLLVELRSLLGV